MRPLWWVLAVSILAGIFLPMAMGGFDWRAAIGATLAFWVVLTTLEALRERVRNKPDKLKALAAIPSGFYGMVCGHLGIAIFITGITMVSVYEREKDLPLAPGDSFVLGDYEFRFDDVSRIPGPNYTATVGTITVSKDARVVTVLTPEKRSYPTQAQSMTEAAIDAGLFRDLYVSLGEPLDDRNTWSVRLYYKPFIRWIWLGTIFMALGGLLGALDPRYRMARLAADRRRVPPGVAAETV